MDPSSTSSDRGGPKVRQLLHELANDLAVIQMRADLLIATTAAAEAALRSQVQEDLVVLRSTVVNAISTAEQFALIMDEVEFFEPDQKEA